ncbi:Ferritin-like protein [Marinomonas spartinae]|uniref:ferritin-like domain-containing protein n=1 Tax=Marinomonas spartinae TaxID=1792290 RepID=UPI000808D837|nr:ferritin-like domain-containing protein [Marinomonas spartinae]SBS36022.1 Ferritin-like protein [Marinomonas spartinae]
MEFQRLAAAHLKHNPDITKRSPKHILADMNALHCLAQAAVNVELFTIPLYMTTMYSIQGMHSITEKPPEGQKPLYYGRRWPGITPTPKPTTENETACNTYFSVFIQEMLHLQLASNICSALGNNYKLKTLYGPGGYYVSNDILHPVFTSPLLVNKNNGWICYGPDKTTIPHILDLTDLDDPIYSKIKVKLGGLDENSINLALAIEQDADELAAKIKPDARDKYIATKNGGVIGNVPFKDWKVISTEANLPMFGSIAAMYECLAAYLNISYDISEFEEKLSITIDIDGQGEESIEIEERFVREDQTVHLFDLVFNPDSVQQDLFNTEGEGHPLAEFPKMKTRLDADISAEAAKQHIFQMMNAITDQGEGSTMKIEPTPMYKSVPGMLRSVEKDYRPDFTALKADYIQYGDDGQQLSESGSAVARHDNGSKDHYERFAEVKELMDSGKITTWADWHKADNTWKANDLATPDFEKNPLKDAIPSAEAVANALNNMNTPDKDKREANFEEMSRVAAGAIAGITTVLNTYWTNPKGEFPFPSMSGSGDRVSICWAIFGKAPDLSLGEYHRIGEKERLKDKPPYLYHACQGMALMPQPDTDLSQCASKEVFHTCRGSNQCKSEGGCGFVQKVGNSGGGCGGVKIKTGSGNTDSTLYSAPADNACGAQGGCAVPISASQLYPEDGEMAVFTFNPETLEPCKEEETVSFKRGEGVYDIAWEAYAKALAAEDPSKTPEPKPEVSDLRLVFPPST